MLSKLALRCRRAVSDQLNGPNARSYGPSSPSATGEASQPPRQMLSKIPGMKPNLDKSDSAQHLGEAVDRVRRKENKTLRAAGDDRLTGTRYDWLRNPAAMEPKDRREFAELRTSGLKTARAWALKETAMSLYSYVYERPARKHFRWWHSWAVRSRLQPMIEVARMLKRRFENIITYLRHRITNAASESINAKVQWVKYTARGFRNRRNFVHAIYFHCGGLDLAPGATK